MISIKFKLIIVSVLILLAVVSDLRTYKIKNSITYSFMLAGLTTNVARDGFKGLAFSFQGIMLPAACLLILYIMRAIGAGDIKLLSAIGAVMGSRFALYAAAYSFICGGFIAAGIILVRRNGIARFKYFLIYIKSCLLSMELLQYADSKNKQYAEKFHFSIAIALGTIAAIIDNGLIAAYL